MEISLSEKTRALTLNNEGETLLETKSFREMAQFLVEEHPEEAECFALKERNQNAGCNDFKMTGLDSEDRNRLSNLIFRFFYKENNPCPEITKEEW